MGKHLQTGDLNIWTEQVGEGPDVLLIGGLGNTVESWQYQLDGLADSYRLTAFDNRGAGRTVKPSGPGVNRNASRRRSRRPWRLRRIVSPCGRVLGRKCMHRSWPCVTPRWSAAWSCKARGQ